MKTFEKVCTCDKTATQIELEKILTGCKEHEGECCDCGTSIKELEEHGSYLCRGL